MDMSRGLLGGNWNNSAKCSSRSSNWNNSPLNLNSNNSARRVTDTADIFSLVAESDGPLADPFTLSRNRFLLTAKHKATAPLGLVGFSKARVGGPI